jgi:AdoMet-dependent heme synthase
VRSLTFPDAPARVYWELTRACDLACRHCRAEAEPGRSPAELDTDECERVLCALAAAAVPPHVVFTGGDPLKRPDLFELIRYGTAMGLGVSLAPSATMALSGRVARDLREAGVAAMSLSLDGSSPARHDRIRGVFGCFGWTLAAAAHVVGAGIPLQINTLVTADSEPDLEDTAKLVTRLGASRWSLFFVIPVGRGSDLPPLTAAESERVLRWIAMRGSSWPFVVTTTEAPHYRRVLIDTLRAGGHTAEAIAQAPAARGFGIRDGNGIMFIASNGDITPSGFLPLVAGNVRRDDPLEVYRHTDLFRSLREPEHFHGRCGVCSYRALCGGSRARAYATTGDVLGEDPLCAHVPRVAA